MKRTRRPKMQLAGLGLIAAAAAATGCGNDAPERATGVRPVAAKVDVGISLPPGFGATVFADGLGAPRHIAVRDNGDVFVTLRNTRQLLNPDASRDGLVALRDTNGDGVADVTEHFGRGDTHTGMAIYDDHVYYSSATAVYAIELDQNLAPRGDSELVVGGLRQIGRRTFREADCLRR